MCWGPIGPQQLNCIAATYKNKIKIFNCKINVRTVFLGPENMGKDTKIDFLSHILRKLWGIKYLAHLAQTAIIFCAWMAEKLLKGA